MGVGLLPIAIPRQIGDSCGEIQELNCNGEIKSNSVVSDTFEIVYPEIVSDILPLTGGAIVKIDISGLKIKADEEIISILNSELDDLNGLELENDFSSMNEAKLNVNNALFKIGNKNVKTLTDGTKRKAPEIFMSTTVGDDSFLVDNVISSEAYRICKFRYIPIQTLNEIIKRLNSDKYINFIEAIGVSGKSFSKLFEKSSDDEAGIIDLITEFFPIYNIDEKDILFKSLNATDGGFYTIDEDGKNLYLKTPDISGRDIEGFSSELFLDSVERNLYFEINQKGTFKRIKIEKYLAPPTATILDSPTDFPEGSGAIEVTLASGMEDISEIEAYLSVLTTTQPDLGESRGVEVFAQHAEIFSVPLLTECLEAGGEPTISEEEQLQSFINNKNSLTSIFASPPIVEGDDVPLNASTKTGVPFFGGSAFGGPTPFFAEKNRPDIVIAKEVTGDKKEVTGDKKEIRRTYRKIKKNNKQYLKPKTYGASQILVSNRPKLCRSIPNWWISSSGISNSNSEGNLVINFSEFDILNKEKTSDFKFNLYLKDKIGQIVKIPGVISLSTATPTLESITPDGFSGGARVTINDPDLSLTIKGDDLADVKEINFTPIGSSTPARLINAGAITKNQYIVTTSDNTVQIRLTNGTTLSNISSNFSSSQRYIVTVVNSAGKSPSGGLQFFTADDTQDLPAKTAELFKFDTADGRLKWAKGKLLGGIPILSDGQSAEIKLTSKDKAFAKGNELYAYFGVTDSSALEKLSNSSDRVTINSKRVGTLIVPINIQYSFSTSPLGGFSRLSNKKAIIRFPGPDFASFNFSDFEKLEKAHIIISNQKITADITELNEEDHVVLEIGGSDAPPFVNPPYVTNIIVKNGAEIISAAPTDGTRDSDNLKTLGLGDAKPGSISAFLEIKEMAVTFNGADHDGKPNIRNYTFKLGGTKINSSLSENILKNTDGGLIAYFENVTTKEEGILPVTVEKKDRDFNVTLRSSPVFRKVSSFIKSGEYEIDPEDGSLIISGAINKLSLEGAESGFIEGATKVDPVFIADLLVPQTNSGILLKTGFLGLFTEFYNPVSIVTNIALNMNISGSLTDPTEVREFVEEPDISNLGRNLLEIPIESIVRSGDYYIDPDGNAILFTKVTFNDSSSIKFNVPEVCGFVSGKNRKARKAAKSLSELESKGIDIVAGGEYTVVVCGAGSKDFVVVLDDPEGIKRLSVKPKKVKRVQGEPGKYIAVITIPEDTLSFGVTSAKCFDVCASTSNSSRNGAKLTLGGPFVVDVDEQFKKLLLGPLMDKIPAIGDLKEFLENFPLRFLKFELKIPPIAKALIQSFCDFSFHLLAELKFALNGFQALLIPMQIIFCIIDVICSLMNPIKLASAVIRLFQCLYDLILLLPVISVPVMLLQLILHLLELLKCIIEKILFTIIAINEIIKAIDRAFTEKSFEALLALEEVLSQYLFEIEADLTFLDPVLAILAIFLQILQLIFRFPCKLAPGDGNNFCLDGSLLAGLVAGVISNDQSEIIPDALIPVGQPYTNLTVLQASGKKGGSSADLEEPNSGNVVATQSTNSTYLDSMRVDQYSLRGTKSSVVKFGATFQPVFTKTKKGKERTSGGSARSNAVMVEFQFKERAENGFFNPNKVFDPDQTMDTPLRLLSKDGNDLVIASGKGNFISPIDGEEFITKNGDYGNTKIMTLDIEVPIRDESGNDTGRTELLPLSYDDIPTLAIMDEMFNLYFITKDGIVFDSDNNVESITAKMINNIAAQKIKFSREQEEFNKTPNNPNNDDKDSDWEDVKVYDFPQLFFVDMREARDDIIQACQALDPATFLLDDNDSDEITKIVEDAEDCLKTWQSGVLGMVSDVRTSLGNGVVPELMDIDKYDSLNETVTNCLNGVADDICRFVVNTLNTSFKVLEDTDSTPLDEFVGVGKLDDAILDDFEEDAPPFTGAREYAAGIGDSAQIEAGGVANISLIPRDSYDTEILGDFTDKIIISIISDSGGNASFIRNNEGGIVTKNGTEYTAKLTSSTASVVKLRARICNRTVQAVTLAGLDLGDDGDGNCVTSPEERANQSVAGALTRVDRILTVFFNDTSTVAAVSESDSGGASANSDPQEFGTGLEN